MAENQWVQVTPTYRVTKQEYEQRFAGLPLEDYRRRMKPELSECFVRRIGIIESPFGPDEELPPIEPETMYE